MQRSFLGEIRTLRPCAACRGFGTIIPDPCRECSGDGRVRSRRTLTVKIPAGVDTGTRVQLTEQGEVGPGGGPAGDLYVEIHVAPARRRSPATATTCTARSRVPMTAAALGTTLTLPTLEADVEDGRRLGRRDRVRARGPPRHPVRRRAGAARSRCPGLRGGRGDLVVDASSSRRPTRLDPRQEELLARAGGASGARSSPTGQVRPGSKSVFGRLRDAFNPH